MKTDLDRFVAAVLAEMAVRFVSCTSMSTRLTE
jgi:hypothetical protein